MPKRRQLRAFDLRQIEGLAELIGVDEAGRGALAGPVVAGAVLVTKEFLEGQWAATRGGRVNDSKQLTPEQRSGVFEEIEQLMLEGQLHATYGEASVDEIEGLNILGASKLAMRRALEGIYQVSAFAKQIEPDLFSSVEQVRTFQPQVSCRILVDGLPLRGFAYPHTALVRGDARSLCVAMASIVAKVTRDRMMEALEIRYPGYGFAQHKGYGTDEHREAVIRLGRCPCHRGKFLRKLMSGWVDPDQLGLFDERSPESDNLAS
jgi:ribonuclease HII